MTDVAATVVIPNYNGMRFFPRLMESLAAQTRRDFGVLVLDDGSTDGSVAWLRVHHPDVALVSDGRNLGFAARAAAGLDVVETPFVALLNNDTWVDPRWFEAAMRAFDEPDVGAVASLVLRADPPHAIDSAGDAYSIAGGAAKRLSGRPRGEALRVSRETFSACGASAFFRTAALRAAGSLDPAFGGYYEDVDLGFRLHWAGWRCVLVPQSVCYHHVSSSYDPRRWRFHFLSARNAEIVWWSDVPAQLRRRWFFPHTAFVALQMLANLPSGRAIPVLAGKLAALGRLSHIREKRRLVRRIARVGDSRIEALLVRDWWGLHVAPRLPRLMRRGERA